MKIDADRAGSFGQDENYLSGYENFYFCGSCGFESGFLSFGF